MKLLAYVPLVSNSIKLVGQSGLIQMLLHPLPQPVIGLNLCHRPLPTHDVPLDLMSLTL
jgi:hypothetical protein